MSDHQKRRLGPFPMDTIKRVDRPTTLIEDSLVQRVDEREQGFHRAMRGNFGAFLQKERSRFVMKHPLSASLMQMQTHLRSVVDGVATAQKAPLPERPAALSRHIKETAYFLRADSVGICELPPYAVYSHGFPKGEPIECSHKYAIAILIDQDYRTARASTGHDWISNSMSFMAYSASGFIACILADYVRRLGYPARAHHARNYQIVLPPVLLWAGLGEMSRIGNCVVHPFLGPVSKQPW